MHKLKQKKKISIYESFNFQKGIVKEFYLYLLIMNQSIC